MLSDRLRKNKNKLPIHATILANFKNVMLLKKTDIKRYALHGSVYSYTSRTVQEQAKQMQDDLNQKSGYS